jgi:hypothetical protein
MKDLLWITMVSRGSTSVLLFAGSNDIDGGVGADIGKAGFLYRYPAISFPTNHLKPLSG